MISSVLQVALGGAIGAAGRYLTGLAVLRILGPTLMPMGVMTANVLGCFLMGAISVFLGHKGLSHLNLFLMTGILGGYTTFSAFGLETWTLIERGQVGTAALYVVLSVGVSMAALIGGISAMRMVLT